MAVTYRENPSPPAHFGYNHTDVSKAPATAVTAPERGRTNQEFDMTDDSAPPGGGV